MADTVHPSLGSTSGRAMPVFTDSDLDRFWSKVEIDVDCWRWMGSMIGSGYGGFSHGTRHTHRTLLAHRVAFADINGPIPEGQTVSHLCHNRRCVRPAHLVAEPIQSNLGRSITGENHKDAKLTSDQVIDIRARFDDGSARVSELAREFGVNPGTVSLIVRRKTWRLLPDDGGANWPK